MNLNKSQKLLSNFLKILSIIILGLFLNACSEERVPEIQKPVKKTKRLMSDQTSLSASKEESITLEFKETGISNKELSEIFENHSGIQSFSLSKRKLNIKYNPAILTPDSIKQILRNYL